MDNSSPASSPEMALLPGFNSIRQVHELPSDALRKLQKINVIGFVKDFQPPAATNGEDWICTLTMVDSSIAFESSTLKLYMFWLPQKLPRTIQAGDVVLVRNAKAQMRDGVPALLFSKFGTEVHVLSASQIPNSPSTSANAPWISYSGNNPKVPTILETNFVIVANQHVADLALPSTMEFQEKSVQAMNIKDKFSLLKDVQDGRFYNIIGQVIKTYDNSSDHLTVYLSDYTAHSKFYSYAVEEGDVTTGRDGDEYNYLSSHSKVEKDWPGPRGKMTIQLTLFDAQADEVREKFIHCESWVLLKNVQVKYGRTGACLEGFMRGDGGKVNVEVLQRLDDSEPINPRWKEAISRKRDWQRRESERALKGKRKRQDEPVKLNNKARRREKRAALQGKDLAKEQVLKAKLDLNENVSCEHPDEPIVLLSDVLKPRTIIGPAGSAPERTSPFDVRKCRSNVRIVGYSPPKIENFAVGRRPSDFDMLSDHSGGEDTDLEEDMREFRSGKPKEKKWEWRFALQVVDASDKDFKERAWLMVSNYDAQMLLDMNAQNLRTDTNKLQEVKDKLFTLWGDLEENTSAITQEEELKKQKSKQVAESSPPSSPKPGDQPPLDSDDEGEPENAQTNPKSRSFMTSKALVERDANAGAADPDEKTSPQIKFTNKAFTCCIKQYGARVKEQDPSLANAGEGKRWERQFGLFGTKIL